MNESSPLIGMAVGEAFALPYDGLSPKSPKLTNINPNDTLESKSWGQATKMATLLARNLVNDGTYNPVNVLSDYVDWYRSGDHKNLIDTLTNSFDKVLWGVHWNASADRYNNDCGSALRSAPIGLFFRSDYHTVVDMAVCDAKLTHKNINAVSASAAIALGVALLAEGLERNTIVEAICNLIPACSFQEDLHRQLNNSVEFDVYTWDPDNKVENTVIAAFQCLVFTNSFHESIVMATRLGRCCSFTASMAGALAGAYYGSDQVNVYIPEIEDGDHIKHLDHMLCVSAPKIDFSRI